VFIGYRQWRNGGAITEGQRVILTRGTGPGSQPWELYARSDHYPKPDLHGRKDRLCLWILAGNQHTTTAGACEFDSSQSGGYWDRPGPGVGNFPPGSTDVTGSTVKDWTVTPLDASGYQVAFSPF
jgi:hypothetical protein